MAAATAAVSRRLVRSGPTRSVEQVSVTAIAIAWSAMAVHDLGPSHPHPSVVGRVPGWSLMVVAMMGPVVFPAVVHVAGSSLRWRRSRAAVEFATAYLGIWLAFGAVAMAVASLAPSSERALVASLLAAGAVWQVSPAKVRALRNCHRAVPLPPTGWRASVACARFAWVHGVACLGTCWPAMAVMAVVRLGHFPWSLALTLVLLAERRAARPRRAARLVGVGFAAAAAVIALSAVAP